MLDLLWRARFRWKLWPRQATGDRKYGTEKNLVAIESQHIHAYIPSPDNDHRTECFSSQAQQTTEASSFVLVCAFPFTCAAIPPRLAIARRFSLVIEAKPLSDLVIYCYC
jgi:hypothetical protein